MHDKLGEIKWVGQGGLTRLDAGERVDSVISGILLQSDREEYDYKCTAVADLRGY